MQVFGPNELILFIMETPKLQKKINFSEGILKNQYFLNSDKNAATHG